MSFISDLSEKPASLSAASKYTVMNGYIYLGLGGLLIVWPGAVQALAWQEDGPPVLWLANLTGQEQSVEIVGFTAREARLMRLDRERFVAATSGPDGLARTETSASAGPMDLDAYAVARLEFGG